jgi:FlaA1/EpsC-like NDP-sugar epimerase
MVIVRDFSVIVPIFVLLIFVVVFKPIIVMAIMGILNHRKRTSFLTAISFAQVSEFSFILLFAGNSLNQVTDKTMAIIIAVGSITFVSSTYFIMFAGKLYRFLGSYLKIFEREDATEKKNSTEKLENHIILIGLKRMGEGILEALKKDEKNKIVAVDFDPDIIESLKNEGFTAFFGDIADPEIQELAGLDKARLIISTVSDPEDNLFILDGIRRLKKKPTVVLLALEKEDAKEFYKLGADYVVLPHLAGGHHLAKILVEKDHLELIERYRKKDLESFLK